VLRAVLAYTFDVRRLSAKSLNFCGTRHAAID
jgi:hypothetical protein